MRSRTRGQRAYCGRTTNLPRLMAGTRADFCPKLAWLYALWGALWILGSDALLAWWLQTGWAAWLVDSIKGLVFIAVTSGLLHLLCRWQERQHALTEQALRDSRERLSLALEAANQGLYDFDIQTGAVIVNDTYATMLGHDPASFRIDRDAWREQMHPEDREPVDRTLTNYLEGRIKDYRVEFRMRTATGGWRWILSMGRVVERDERGRARRMLGTHTDITERKSSEARTSDALAFAKTVLHFSSMGVIVYGPDGRAVIANPSAAGMVGTDVPGLLRQNFRELESWQRSGLLVAAERALRTGEEQVFKGPLHTSFDRDLWIEARFVPFSYAGARHLLLLLDNVTEEHNALENLHLLHAALQAAPAGCLITDAEGLIEWVNPTFTKQSGYEAAEVLGLKTSLLRSGRHSAEFYRNLWQTILRGDTWSGEVCNRRKDGTFYDEHMTVAPVRDADGIIRHFVAIKIDITERKQLEQQVTRTQRLESIGMLASGVAHDLNNVLTPILLSIELLKAKYPAADAAKYVDTVETAAKRGAGIVRQVLTFARGMDGGESTEVQPRYLLKDVVQLIEETFPRNIEIGHEVPRDIRTVVGDLCMDRRHG